MASYTCRTFLFYMAYLMFTCMEHTVNSQDRTTTPPISAPTSPANVCSSTQFHCFVNGSVHNYRSNGKPCIPLSWQCDGAPDCIGEEDEQNCGCDPDQFQCKETAITSTSRCIPLSHRCDHTHDCKNSEDEKNCSYPACRSDQFRCAESEKCIPESWKCNKILDCGDGSDEHDKICGGIKCPAGKIACYDHCIEIDLACNGDNDCAHIRSRSPR